MESRKSMHKRFESSLHNSPTSSSPLRRKSIIKQKQPSSVLLENDDEAERIARRREICSSTPLSTASSKRHSLGLGFLANIPAPEMIESISQCIKLSAENKINVKNAFSLEMIDFMTYMIKKQDDNMSNLQVASTSLDVSTKIYGFRVDSVHTEILKIVGGLDKQIIDDAEQNLGEQGEILEEDIEMNLETQKKKKKKKARQKIFSTMEALRGNIEIAKPVSMMIGEGDLQTSDMLYQVMLPNHANSGFCQHLYNDVLVDVIEREGEPKLQQNCNPIKSTIPLIKDFRDQEICTSYLNFEFLGWSIENEPEETLNISEEEKINNGFQFDLEATVVQEDDPIPEPVNYFDIENDNDNEEVRSCYQQTVERCDEIPTVARSSKVVMAREYSFMLPNMNLHWAGPSHWKFRNLTKSLTGANVAAEGKIVGTCMQAPLKRRKEIELLYGENQDVIEAKFALSQSNKLQAKTAKAEWSADILTLPEDIHYDIVQAIKLYLHLVVKPSQSNNGKDHAATIADVSDNDRYDYNNPNDISNYCPDINNEDYDEGKDDNDENECNFRFEDDAGTLGLASQGFTGDNLVAAPKLANKTTIAYCLKAKRIDMRQLKKSIWRCLRSTSNVDNTNITETIEQVEKSTMKETKQFSEVYKVLPKLLTKDNAEALSVPLSFISLLHLANEKELKVSSLPDMSDVVVESDIMSDVEAS